jgi:hypothetical protein
MTEQAGPPPFDPAHPMIGNQIPQWLSTGKHKSPDGDLAIFTFRVPNATVTAVLSKADAQKWIDQMQDEVDGLSSLSIAPAGVPLPPMTPGGFKR